MRPPRTLRTPAETSMLNDRVADALRRLRAREGLSQAAFADRLGITASFYTKIEQSVSSCPLHVLASAALEFEVTLDALIPLR